MNIAEQLDANSSNRVRVEIDRKLHRLADVRFARRNPSFGVGTRVRMRNAVAQIDPNATIIREVCQRVDVAAPPRPQGKFRTAFHRFYGRAVSVNGLNPSCEAEWMRFLLR